MRYHKKHIVSPYSDLDKLELSIDGLKIVSELSKTALKLYVFIREESIKVDKIVYFDRKKAKYSCEFKQDKSVYNALSELINVDILAGRSEYDEFYYNPKFITNEKEKL
jgi:hypothetical protein